MKHFINSNKLYKIKGATKNLMTSRGNHSSPDLFIHAQKDKSGATVPLKFERCPKAKERLCNKFLKNCAFDAFCRILMV